MYMRMIALGQTKGQLSPVTCCPVVGTLEESKGKAVGNGDLRSKVDSSPQ